MFREKPRKSPVTKLKKLWCGNSGKKKKKIGQYEYARMDECDLLRSQDTIWTYVPYVGR